MFYEGIGKLLAAASELLGAGDGDGDAKAQRAQRGIQVLLRRLGAVWPSVFSALARELEVYERVVARGRATLAEQGFELHAEVQAASPVERYAQLQRELDALVVALHEQRGAAWARPALHEVRKGMAEAAAVQGELVEAMLAH